MDRAPESIEAAVDALVEEYRGRCLWFLRPDYRPTTREDRLRALDYIERNGDLVAYQRAAKLKRCLSLGSSASSAG